MDTSDVDPAVPLAAGPGSCWLGGGGGAAAAAAVWGFPWAWGTLIAGWFISEKTILKWMITRAILGNPRLENGERLIKPAKTPIQTFIFFLWGRVSQICMD